MTLRVAILARFSTDRQRDSSCDDQIAVCRPRAERDGWSIVAEYRDERTSGSTLVANRIGGAKMLADAMADRFDVLLLEGLDRLARDLVEQETIVRRLEHRGIRIIGVTDGYDSALAHGRKVQRLARGIVNEIYLDDVRRETHRGLSGRVAAGLFAGGMSYGYRSVVAGLDAKGEPLGYRLEIDEDEAKWVRYIFDKYAEGWSARRIAHELNNQHVPSPRGGTWAVSALYGSQKKGTGILNNVLYIGRYIWNRSQWVKDPDTKKRKRIERPRHEWKVSERPELRILTEQQWGAVSARMSAPASTGGGRGKGARPRTLFGGILRCGICGGPVVAVNAYRYGCAASHDRGQSVCKGVMAGREATDSRLLSTIRDGLLSPASVAKFQAEVKRIRAAGSADADNLKRREWELEREIINLTNAIASCGLSDALRARLVATEDELRLIRASRSHVRPAGDAGTVMAGYRRILADLPGNLRKDTSRAREALRAVLGGIRLVQEGNEVWAEITARRDRLLMAAGGGVYGCGSGGAILHPDMRVRIR